MRIQNSLILLAFITGAGFFLSASNKDKFSTKPQLTFKKVNSYHVRQRESLRFEIGVTDKEGDIQGQLYIRSVVKHFPDANSLDSFPIPTSVPKIGNLNATLDVCFSINATDGECPFYRAKSIINRDTTTFSFWIKDQANNISDTVYTDQPVIIEN